MHKIDSMQKLKGSANKEVGISRKNLKEILEIKSTVSEIKNAIDGLISRLNNVEERICEFVSLRIYQ